MMRTSLLRPQLLKKGDSLPLDPAADEFDQRINAVPVETISELRVTAETAQSEKRSPTTGQRGLF